MKQRPNMDPGVCGMLRFSGWLCFLIALFCCIGFGPSPLWLGSLLIFSALLGLAYWVSPKRE